MRFIITALLLSLVSCDDLFDLDYRSSDSESGSPSLTFSSPSPSVAEDAGEVLVGVQWHLPSWGPSLPGLGSLEEPVSVDYYTRDGSAKAGSDYTPVSGRLVFEAGGRSLQFIKVPIHDDGISEGVETFTVHLHDADGAWLLSHSQEVTIRDPEAAGGLGVRQTVVIVIEGDHEQVFSLVEPEFSVVEEWRR
ncbi:MAG: Calx-beta domain-containing protein [Planctomycetota bacterium]